MEHTTHFSIDRLTTTLDCLEPRMIELLAEFVAAQSPSGAEQPATAFLERTFEAMGLLAERIVLDSSLIEDSPMFSCPCDADNGRFNLLARHLPRDWPSEQPSDRPRDLSNGESSQSPNPRGRSVLFNGHVDVVPTGPASLWARPPYEPWVEDGWLHGRGSGDMKGGIVCALIAFEALREMGLQPAGVVGFNAVLDEENTGNGTLATVHALQNAMGKAKLADFDAVIIPEPFGETLMSAQVGVCWLFITLTGKPAHVAYMNQGVNPIEAGIAIMADLKLLEADWNAPALRHPLFRDATHPINFNLGRIEGGEWNSSVPCTCTMGIRFGFFPGTPADEATRVVTERIRATAQRLNPALGVEIVPRGHFSPGCEYDLDAPPMQMLAQAHEKVTGQPPEHLACTATTDGRHFALMTDIPVTIYGPTARHIHGIDEAVSIASMKRVAATMAQFMVDWCGVEHITRSTSL